MAGITNNSKVTLIEQRVNSFINQNIYHND